MCKNEWSINMNQGQRNVNIHLTTTIHEDGEVESITENHKGIFMYRQSMDVLMYEERIDNGGVIKNIISIQPDKVSIKRSGMISMNQQFEIKQANECMYKHPHGSIHMETFTTDMSYQSLRTHEQGQLAIFYNVSLNGQVNRTHKLALTYTEEDLS